MKINNLLYITMNINGKDCLVVGRDMAVQLRVTGNMKVFNTNSSEIKNLKSRPDIKNLDTGVVAEVSTDSDKHLVEIVTNTGRTFYIKQDKNGNFKSNFKRVTFYK